MELLIKDFMTNPVISSLLLMFIFAGIYLEIRRPGWRLPSVIAVIAAVLFFVPHFFNELVEPWEIILFLLGFVFIAIEIFVVPGFGITGILGIVFTLFGLSMALLPNLGFDFTGISGTDFLIAITKVLVGIAGAAIGSIYVVKYLLDPDQLRPLTGKQKQESASTTMLANQKLRNYLGRKFNASTDLRPVGYIEADGQRIEAISDGDWIEKGSRVIATRIHEMSLVVKKVSEPS